MGLDDDPDSDTASFHPERIPGAERARIPAGKAEFLIADKHAAFFNDQLGFDLRDAPELERQLLRQLPRVKGAQSTRTVEGDQKWVAIVRLTARRESEAITVWAARPDGIPSS